MGSAYHGGGCLSSNARLPEVSGHAFYMGRGGVGADLCVRPSSGTRILPCRRPFQWPVLGCSPGTWALPVEGRTHRSAPTRCSINREPDPVGPDPQVRPFLTEAWHSRETERDSPCKGGATALSGKAAKGCAKPAPSARRSAAGERPPAYTGRAAKTFTLRGPMENRPPGTSWALCSGCQVSASCSQHRWAGSSGSSTSRGFQ